MPTADKPDQLDYIRRTYSVPARVGVRIAYQPIPTRPAQFGTIRGARSAYLRVRFDGSNHLVNLHPTWCVEYLKDDHDH